MSNQMESSGPNLAESMPAQAAEFARVCKTSGIALDYLPRTLPLVDRFLNGKRGELQQLTAQHNPQAAVLQKKSALLITAYLGEVIRRETGASWYAYRGSAAARLRRLSSRPDDRRERFFRQRQGP